VPSNLVYLSGKADAPPKELQASDMSDDFERRQRFSQNLESGQDGWKSWALANGGMAFPVGPEGFKIRIPADKLVDVPDMREKYAELVGTTISIGVGSKMVEADRALEAAQKEGGDCIKLYDLSVEDELQKAEPMLHPAFKHNGTGQVYHMPVFHDVDELERQVGSPVELEHFTDGFADKHGNFYNRQQAAHLVAPAPDQAADAGLNPERLESQAYKLRAEQGLVKTDASPEVAPESAVAYGDTAPVQLPPPQVHQRRMVALHSRAYGGGIIGATQPKLSRPSAPAMQDDEHSENEALDNFIASEPVPSAPHGNDINRYAQERLKYMFDSLATKQAQTDEATKQEADKNQEKDSFKKRVASILAVFKKRAPELEQLQEQDPELYQTLVGMIQAMIQMAKEADGPEPVQKSEGLSAGHPESEFDQEVVERGIAEEIREHGVSEEEARRLVEDHLVEDPHYYDLDKVALNPGKTGIHQVNYPVGSQKDASAEGNRDVGKIKIDDPTTGHTKWRSVRAGIVRDENGNPTSSRNQ
jgi:hypothetical protein